MRQTFIVLKNCRRTSSYTVHFCPVRFWHASIWKGGDIKNLILPILLTALTTLTTLQVLNAQCNVWPKYVLWVVARCLLCCFCLSVRFFCLLLVASVCFLSELLQYICLQQQRLCLRHCRPVVSQIGHIRCPSYNKGRPLVKTHRYIHTYIHSCSPRAKR